MTELVHEDLGLVTRACWAKGVPPTSWQQLVARTAPSSLPPVEIEQQICGKLHLLCIVRSPGLSPRRPPPQRADHLPIHPFTSADALLQLLADSTSMPSPLVVGYVQSAVTPSTSVAQFAPSLVRVGFFAARLTRCSAPSIALDKAFEVVKKVLSAAAPDVPTLVVLNADELGAALDWSLGRISRLGTAVSTPGELTLHSPTVSYISTFLQRPPIPFSSAGVDPQRLGAMLTKLDAVVSKLQQLPVDSTAARISTDLQRRLLEIKVALSPNAESTSKVPVVPRARIASPRPMNSLDLVPTTQADPDIAFLISDLSHRGHTSVGVANTPVATARIVALLKDRLAQADARGSTNEQALSRAFLEMFLAATVDLRESVGNFTQQASFAYSRLPELLRDIVATTKVDVQGSPELVRSALDSSVRLFSDSTRTESEDAMALDGALSRPVLDALVAGLCQHELISTDLAASLSPSLHQTQLVPSAFPSTTAQLTSGSIDSVREVFASLETLGPTSHQAISDSLVEAVSSLASSVEIPGLSSICSVLVEQPSILSIVFLHVQPFLVLSPIRSLLDTFGSSLENLGYDDPSTGYGVVLLFLQVVVSRHSLQTDLAHHLGSRRGFLAQWLPSISATYSLTSLADDAKATVNGWIHALFGDGISDELMHQTNPRTLLKVLPTVAKQSLAACHAGVIDAEQLRDGLSFLLQGLLSFTLPGVLKWLVGEIERTPAGNYQTMMLDILSVLIFSESLPKTIVELIASDLVTLVHRLPSTISTTIDVKRVQGLIQPYRRAIIGAKGDATPIPSTGIAAPMELSFDRTIYSSSLTSMLYTLLNSSPPASSLIDEMRMTRLAKTILLVPSHSSDLVDAHASRFTSFILQDLPSKSIDLPHATKLGSWIGEALKAYQFIENEMVNEGQSSGGVFDLLVASVVRDVKRRRALKLGDDEAVEAWAQALIMKCRAVGEGLEKA